MGNGKNNLPYVLMDAQAAGMIHYRYGRIAIADRAALEEAACECYKMVPRPEATPLPAAAQ